MTLRTKGLAPIVTGLTKIGTGGARSLGGLSGLQKTQLKLFNNDQTPLATTTVKLASPVGTAIRLHWGDGNFDDLVCDSALKTLTHDYAGVGAYEIGISGDIDRLLQLQCFSQAFISGDIANLSALTSLTHLYLYNTSVDGDIANLSALTSLTLLYLNNTSVTYSTFVHPAGWKDCDIQCRDCAWSTGEVDQIMIDHDAITVGAYTSDLTIDGTNAARTNPGAGENARASLDGKGKAVAVN